MQTTRRWGVTGLVLLVSGAGVFDAAAQPGGTNLGTLRRELAVVARLEGEPRSVSAAGMTDDETPLLTLENRSAFDPSDARRRLVIVGGMDGDANGARLALEAVRWFKTGASESDRTGWVVSVLPLADPTGDGFLETATFPPTDGFFNDPDQRESRYIWRWVTYQVPDLVVELRVASQGALSPTIRHSLGGERPPEGSLSAALANSVSQPDLAAVETMWVTAGPTEGEQVMRAVLALASGERSPLAAAVRERVTRDPLAVARVLAERYPETPGIAYIPAVAWVHTLRLATLLDEPSLGLKVMNEVAPWLSGDEGLFGETVRLSAVAGTMVFGALAKLAGAHQPVASRWATEGVAIAAAESVPGVPLHASGWSDDLFLGTIAAATAGDAGGLDAATRLIVRYAEALQRSDGLFNHAADAETAWGRGNGFAAIGLAETLSALDQAHPAREPVLAVYRRLMTALREQQAPDGMWRQVVDRPGSYRETSVTALTVTAMARGLRRGWLDDAYRSIVERGWRALLAHVVPDGRLVDVCISTGSGLTLQHYLDRTAINGADDRGGALVLGATLEVHALHQAE